MQVSRKQKLGFVTAVVVAVAVICGVAYREASTTGSPNMGSKAVAATVAVGSSSHTIESGGRQREYRLYRPADLADPAPLVVMLHGGFGSAAQAESYYGWDAEADSGHFLVLYPDGVDRAWNVGGGCCGKPAASGIDDVAFVSAAVAAVRAEIPVSANRIYATGISNGGLLAYRLACDTKLFAAIGPDSATLLGPCRDPAAISVIHVHGTADRNIPYDGGRGDGFAHINGPAIPSLIATWRATDACAPPTSTVSGVVTVSIAACPEGRAVELITIAGAGHQWPGSPSKPLIQRILGTDPPATALNATEEIWRFFAAHAAPGP